jgi:hypothetical protein
MPNNELIVELLNYFLLQMNDKESIQAAQYIEFKFRCLNGVDGLNLAVESIKKEKPARLEFDWVPPLLEAVSAFYTPLDDSFPDRGYTNPFECFIEAVFEKLSGGDILHLAESFSLEHFSEDELSQPHLQWVKKFVQRHAELSMISKPFAIRMAQVHPLEKVDDATLLELNDEFNKNNINHMEFTDYVRWFTRSRDHFLVENETLEPECEKRMKETLFAWFQGGQSDVGELCYWLARNYKFHKKHHDFLKRLIEGVIRTSEK